MTEHARAYLDRMAFAAVRAVGRERFDAANNYGRLIEAIRTVGTVPA